MRALEEAVGPLEGGEAVAFASGMAAANAIMDLLPVGAVVVAAEFTYTGVALRLRELDERGAITLRRVDIADTAAVVEALAGADAVWIESPTNPMMEVADIPAISAAAHAVDALVICDNTFATPLGQLREVLRFGFVCLQRPPERFCNCIHAGEQFGCRNHEGFARNPEQPKSPGGTTSTMGRTK